MRRFFMLVALFVAMLLLTTSIVGAESPGAINSKPGCGSESPGNGKGKANGHDKNCENESDSPPESTTSDPAPSTESNLTTSDESDLSQAPDEVPNWSANEDPVSSRDPSAFTADANQVNTTADCFLNRGRSFNQGSGNNCERERRSFTETEKEPMFLSIDDECLDETIYVSGTILVLSHSTIDGNGRAHTKAMVNPMGVSGYGEESGTVYRGNGVTMWRNEFLVGETQTYINNFLLIGHGSAPNLRIHQNVRSTMDANGDITYIFDHTTVTCS